MGERVAIKARGTEAGALLTQMVGQVGQEAADACDRERWYAAAALTRQIVRGALPLGVFRDDAPQRARWLSASTNRIENSFRPASNRMRHAGDTSRPTRHCSLLVSIADP